MDTTRNSYPDDPEYFIAQLARGRDTAVAEPASAWVEPYYAGIPTDGDLPMGEAERTVRGVASTEDSDHRGHEGGRAS
ncbi:hypothetical protein [Amycolatopsis sp. FDAARGOS 1241]|uniref:hypothetical protein n=1 Tax=Amycolatopsis sp. FDAARGOS 1241 TaxID=2778070 RepID=UPI00194F5CCB|nr:hypothetical protein [Amycolatopsis sp. FDAARGOS 1241]QRP48587.1 hypothetical protein I6J71_12540 [Amycolatopsis sp. FDAARGOS 1241]